MSVTPAACRAVPSMAVTLMGVFWTVDSRFSAVTTTSSRVCAGAPVAAVPEPACAVAWSARAVPASTEAPIIVAPINVAPIAARSFRAMRAIRPKRIRSAVMVAPPV